MGSTICMKDLPDEILEEIFSHISFKDLFYSVKHVCLRWKEVANYSRLQKNLIYQPGQEESDSEIVCVLKLAPKLESFILTERVVSSTVLEEVLLSCPHLKRIEFSEHQYISKRFLLNLLDKYPNIELLDVSVCKELTGIMGDVHNLNTLRITVICPYTLSGNQPVLLKPLADGCPALENLHLKGVNHCRDDLDYFLVKKQHQLRTLHVRLWDSNGELTIPRLHTCTALTTLILEFSFGHHLDNVLFASSLRLLTTVTSLTLFNFLSVDINDVISAFKNMNMSQLVELHIKKYDRFKCQLADVIIENCPRLKVLHLTGCKHVCDRSLENLYTLQELQNFSVRGSFLTDNDVGYISKCRNLQYLDLSYCNKFERLRPLSPLTDLRVLKLDGCNLKILPLTIITNFKHLTLLSIVGSRFVDQKGLMQLKREMPHLKICNAKCTFWR